MDWKEFLDFAETLKGDTREAAQRSAVSRAYYSAYHCARNYLRSVEPQRPFRHAGDEHKSVWDALSARPLREEKSAGSTGIAFRINRNQVDYDDTLKEKPSDMVDKALRAAQSIRNNINAAAMKQRGSPPA